MALRHVGGPAFPLGIQIGQRIDGRDARSQGVVGPRQQLRPPGRNAGPRVQQRHVGFPPVERRVQDRQVGDLQGDDHQAGSGGNEHDRRGCRAGRNREPEGEHRGPGDGEGRRNAALLERPQQQHVAEEGDPQPGDQLREQDRGSLGGKHLVTPPVIGDGAGYEPEHPVHAPVHPPCQPAADLAGHDQGPDDAGPCREHERERRRRRPPSGQRAGPPWGSPWTVGGYAEPTEARAAAGPRGCRSAAWPGRASPREAGLMDAFAPEAGRGRPAAPRRRPGRGREGKTAGR